MKTRSRLARLAVGGVLALVGFAAVTATATAARPATDARQVRPGLSDFGIAGTTATARPVTDARQVRPGLSDFGRVSEQSRGAPSTPSGQPVVVASSNGFDWTDAGVGAAAMLGVLLLAGGLGAAVVLRGHRREFRSA